MDKTNFLGTIEKEGIKFVNLLYVDLLGRTRSMLIPSSKVKNHLEKSLGTGFDGSSGGLGLAIEHSDAFLKADQSAFTILPWEEEKTAAVICDLYGHDGKPLPSDPRFILKETVNRMKKELGKEIEAIFGPEMEWYYFKKLDDKLILVDEGGYMAPPSSDMGYEPKKKMALTLEQMGIAVDKIHHEVPHSKGEINFEPATALKAADTIVFYKIAVKAVAASWGLVVTLMPKPYADMVGTGMHTHINLANARTGQNLFADKNSKYGLSHYALYFIGGLLRHAKALAAVATPTVNSYKRLVPLSRFEAPVYLSWGLYNRSALIRVPVSSQSALRFEYRPVDATCNPYLAFACIIEAGLDGIKKKIMPPDPMVENIYHIPVEERKKRGIDRLPASLGEALDEMEKDDVVRRVMGDQTFEKYLTIKRDEWLEYCTLVTDWERKKYLDA
jgi:glutamine synthetase